MACCAASQPAIRYAGVCACTHLSARWHTRLRESTTHYHQCNVLNPFAIAAAFGVPTAHPLPGVYQLQFSISAPHTALAPAGKRALVSVSDKAGLSELAKGLHSSGYELVSTGGSAKAIADAGVPVTKVEQLTGFPEMLDGRVKTLHPAVHGGILARRDLTEHTKALAEHGIGAIDVVIVNLYPFRATVTAQPPPEFADGVENIDIGGPAMIRAAAKNHAYVTVIVDPADYQALLDAVGSGDAGGDGSAAFRRRCAWKAFQVRTHGRCNSE